MKIDYSQDFYAILGVSPTATSEDIRAAYRSAAKRFHPDTNKHPGAAIQLRDINTAYEILSDTVKRADFDSTHKAAVANERQYFALRLTPSKRMLAILEEPQVMYVLAEVVPERRKTEAGRSETNLNLTLVLDRSTSMNGPRLERTRAADFQIIEQLNANDYLSIVTFSDRAEVVVKAGPVLDKPQLRAMVATMQASGATEIYQGLSVGAAEVKRNASKRLVNHIILLTDGRTYGDEERCLQLARECANEGIGISAMGLGDEWNDSFLDQLAVLTGGTCEYINTPTAVVRFLNDRVRALGRSIAERINISIAPEADVTLESAFRLAPSAQPIAIDTDPIPLGQLQSGRITAILFQVQVPAGLRPGFRNLMRVDVTGDVIRENRSNYKLIADLSVEASPTPLPEEPPLAIIDALSKLTLYRQQQKAQEALARGDTHEATKRLQKLATNLLNAGQVDLAREAQEQAEILSRSGNLDEPVRRAGTMALKYGTRMLIAGPRDESAEASPQGEPS